ncbi:MAG: hypothetical protein LBB45_04145 [Methanobrevibacter sp.]|jgi:hypothetical protein|nr:hypothetical protein [Candidatus Methanovirga basalitermitum]
MVYTIIHETKKAPHRILLNDDVLILSVNVISDILGLQSAPNATYSEKTIVYHLLNAVASRTSVSNLCVDAP